MDKKQEIQTALTNAMKAQDEDTKRTLRLVMATIKLIEVEDHGEVDDLRILSILQKEVKTREDSIQEAERANRNDLVDSAQRELKILQRFLPQQINVDDIREIAQQVIIETGASNLKDMGVVMKHLMPKLGGGASGQEASKVVRDLLQS